MGDDALEAFISLVGWTHKDPFGFRLFANQPPLQYKRRRTPATFRTEAGHTMQNFKCKKLRNQKGRRK